MQRIEIDGDAASGFKVILDPGQKAPREVLFVSRRLFEARNEARREQMRRGCILRNLVEDQVNAVPRAFSLLETVR